VFTASDNGGNLTELGTASDESVSAHLGSPDDEPGLRCHPTSGLPQIGLSGARATNQQPPFATSTQERAGNTVTGGRVCPVIEFGPTSDSGYREGVSHIGDRGSTRSGLKRCNPGIGGGQD
jgi:hypothetical protein